MSENLYIGKTKERKMAKETCEHEPESTLNFVFDLV